MKAIQPSRFKQHLEKDAARKRKEYTRIQDKSEKEKKEQYWPGARFGRNLRPGEVCKASPRVWSK